MRNARRRGPAFWQPGRMAANILFLLKSKKFAASLLEPKAKNPGFQQECNEMTETEMMLKGYGLTTAEFFYHMPDYAHVLNSFVWQEYDIAPDHPRLFEFVEFWQKEIDGPLHSVQFTHRKLISPGEWRQVVGEFTLH